MSTRSGFVVYPRPPPASVSRELGGLGYRVITTVLSM